MSEPFGDCTEACAVAVPCPTCGRDLPPKGRAVAPETYLPECCDEARFEAVNTRHIWSVDELPGQRSIPVVRPDRYRELEDDDD